MKFIVDAVESRSSQEVLDICNAKLEEWLKEAPVAFGRGGEDWLDPNWTLIPQEEYYFKYEEKTHKARLVCIEEIKE